VSIVTFLMVFLIQNTQARDSAASQAQLDELPKAMENADRRYIALEEMTDQEIERFREKRGPHPGRRSEQRAARSPKGS
jgi:low affinity Fe/Cu permease